MRVRRPARPSRTTIPSGSAGRGRCRWISPMGRSTNSIHGALLSVERDPTLRRVKVYASGSSSGTTAMETDARSSKTDPFRSVAIFDNGRLRICSGAASARTAGIAVSSPSTECHNPAGGDWGRSADYSATPRVLWCSDTTMSYSLTVICITPRGNPAAFAWTYGLDPIGSIRCTATVSYTHLTLPTTILV